MKQHGRYGMARIPAPPPGRDMVRCALDISPGMLYTTLCALQGAGVTASRTQA